MGGGGTPSHHPFDFRIFHEINHPYSYWSNPHRKISPTFLGLGLAPGRSRSVRSEKFSLECLEPVKAPLLVLGGSVVSQNGGLI